MPAEAEMWAPLFRAALIAVEQPGMRHLAVLRPNQNILLVVCPTRDKVAPQHVAEVENLVPPTARRRIAVIAATEPKLDAGDEAAIYGTLDIVGLKRTIPFFGMLLGLVTIGHTVWLFDGQPEALTACCQSADLLIIDSSLTTKLTTKSLDVMLAVMRNRNVLVLDGKTLSIKALRKEAQSAKLEFPNA